MSAQRFTPEFKQEAVRQVTERGYSVAEFPLVFDTIGFRHEPLPSLSELSSAPPPSTHSSTWRTIHQPEYKATAAPA